MSDQHNLKEQLCFSLYNAQRQVNRYYSNKVFKKYNLTYPQFLVLTILWDESPVNVKKVVTELAYWYSITIIKTNGTSRLN